MLKKFCTIIAVVACVIGIAGCAWGGVSLSAFPDPVFRKMMKWYDYGWDEYDSAGNCHRVGDDDGILGDKEIERITDIGVKQYGIKSLKGIEHLTALQTLDCTYNQLTSLNVSGCTALTYLDCAANSLGTLDVSHNTALTWLYCWENQLTELDLSKNTALTTLYCRGQRLSSLKVKRNSDGYYEVNMKDYVSKLENIDADSINEWNYCKPLSYDKETGIITFSEPIRELCYGYMTHSPNNDLMDVTITHPLSIAALERSRSSTYGIICDMTDNSYLDSNGNPLDESVIRYYNYSDYSRLGLTADGNSRLIICVQTDKPGKASFSFNDDIGAKLESLSRKELSASDQLSTTEFTEDLHQVSAVLVAPESFPKDKNFPSDTFKVHVKFTDEDGKVTEDDLELKIEAAPVMLIHGLWGSAEKTFGKESGPGIWHQLKENGFTVGVCDYDGSKGPSEILNGNYNRLYLRLWDMFDKYSERGIVCTKADIVAFGMGGLIAEKYLSDEGKDSNDGNNWSVWSYKQGMVRRLITIATPHYGTRWADLITSAPGTVLSIMDNVTTITSPLDLPLRLLINALIAGNKAFADSQSGLRELCTNAARDYIFPSGVPMFAIYGDVSGLIDEGKIFDDTVKDIVVESALGVSIVSFAASFTVPAGLFVIASVPALAPVLPAVITLAPVIATAVAGTALAYELKGAIELMTAELVKVFNIVMFDDDGHDLAVSIHSAAGDFGSARRGYDGWQYRHWSLPKREDVGRGIASLLGGTSDNFKIFGTDERGALLSANRAVRASLNGDGTESFRFIEALNLKAVADESNIVKFTVTAENATSYDVYCAVCGDEWIRLFKIPSADKTGRKFEVKIPLTSDDIRSANIFCFSHNPNDSKGTSLLISNVAQVSEASEEEEPTPPEIIKASLPSGAKGTPYSFQLAASGTTPITWSLKSGKMPAGLKLDSSGLISGTPTKAGKFTLTFKAVNSTNKNDTAKLTFQVFDPVSITTASLKAGTIGKSYSVTLRAKGTKPITWSAEGLPSGLTINAKTGKISGKPTEYGQFSVNVTASNGAGSVTRTLSLTVKAIPPTLSGSLKKPTLNMPYSSGLKLSKGSAPITWSISGTLPEGLTFDTETGIISGTPTSYAKSGYKITITAKNDAGSKSKRITLKVNGKAPVIKATLPKTATYGQAYTATLKATGSTPITFTVDRLPAGLSLNDGVISGTVTETTKSFKFTVYAENPVKKVKKSFTIKINGIPKSAKETPPENTENESDSETPRDNSDNNAVEPNITDNTENQTQRGNQQTDNHSQTESQKSGVPEGYVIVAELGTVSRDEAGMYDFDVTLSDDVPAGAELMYVANSEKPSDDDEIAEFFDSTGNEITAVPKDRKISVSIWLNPDTIYHPAIAVKH